MASQDQINAAKAMLLALAEAIRGLGSVPSGHLYARIMDKISLSDYERVISILTNRKLIKNENHLLTWIGE